MHGRRQKHVFIFVSKAFNKIKDFPRGSSNVGDSTSSSLDQNFNSITTTLFFLVTRHARHDRQVIVPPSTHKHMLC